MLGVEVEIIWVNEWGNIIVLYDIEIWWNFNGVENDENCYIVIIFVEVKIIFFD